ncbi:MAG: cytochrome P450 [Solirubrobacterales bacterium]
MTLATELDLPQLDYTDPELRGERFHARMEELAGEGWLAGSPLGWLFVTERDAASYFLRSKQVVFPAATVADAFEITEGPLSEAIRKNLIATEGDDHRRLRNLVNPAFNSREADRYRPAMREHLAELWELIAGAGGCEFVGEFAKWYPSRMIATVVGAPVEDAGRLHGWATWFQRQFDPAAIIADRDGIERAIVEFHDYAGELIERRRNDPGDDLISKLLGATYEGDRLSDDECLNLIMNVFAGGVDTTQAQLAHGVRLFASHPEQWQLLRERRELTGAAVEEVLRFEPITPFTARMASEELSYRDITIPAGTVLMISTFSGNRDRDTYEQPLSFDIAADRGKAKPLTFGAGIHNCLGANLARAELQEAFAFLVERIERLELAGEPVYDTIAGVYGLERLPLSFEAAAG